MLNRDSDITEDEGLRGAARRLKWKLAVVWERREANAWEVSRRLDVTQAMPKHSLHFLCTLYEAYRLYKKCYHILPRMWCSVWKSRLYSTDLEVPLGSYCRTKRVSARKSTIQHAKTQTGVFASRSLEKNNAATSYYGSLAYVVLERRLQSEKQ